MAQTDFPCRICRRPTKTFGFTYGACDTCTKRAIDELAAKINQGVTSENSGAQSLPI